MALMELNAAN